MLYKDICVAFTAFARVCRKTLGKFILLLSHAWVNICFQIELWSLNADNYKSRAFLRRKFETFLATGVKHIVANDESPFTGFASIEWRLSTSCEQILPSWPDKSKERLHQFFSNQNLFRFHIAWFPWLEVRWWLCYRKKKTRLSRMWMQRENPKDK